MVLLLLQCVTVCFCCVLLLLLVCYTFVTVLQRFLEIAVTKWPCGRAFGDKSARCKTSHSRICAHPHVLTMTPVPSSGSVNKTALNGEHVLCRHSINQNLTLSMHFADTDNQSLQHHDMTFQGTVCFLPSSRPSLRPLLSVPLSLSSSLQLPLSLFSLSLSSSLQLPLSMFLCLFLRSSSSPSPCFSVSLFVPPAPPLPILKLGTMPCIT
jgi:hypothetical protein